MGRHRGQRRRPRGPTYLYANTTLAAGTVVTSNVSGSYSLNNGVFSGSVSATAAGRTLTLNSDGTTSFNVGVMASQAAVGWSAATGVKFVFDVNVEQVVEYIWNAITNLFTGQYSLTDADSGSSDTTVYWDASGTDGTAINLDGSTDGAEDNVRLLLSSR